MVNAKAAAIAEETALEDGPHVEIIDKQIADATKKLAAARTEAAQRKARCDQLLKEGNREAYQAARFDLDFADGQVRIQDEQIKALEKQRPEALKRSERRDCLQQRGSLDLKVTAMQAKLKKLARQFLEIRETLIEEAALYEEIGKFNHIAQSVGVDLLESPEAAIRFEPAVPARQDGTRTVQRSRLRRGMENSTSSGPDRYETYTTEELIIVPGIPAFSPPPLFRQVVVPEFRRGDPSYKAPGLQLPW
jgi:hypothetical protein